MKIMDPKVIQSGEKAFFNAVKDQLDWNAIREVVTKKMKQCAIESTGGGLISHENSVAFKMDIHCAMDVSIIVDRNGNLVSNEEALADFSKTEIPSVAVPETKTQASSGDVKKKQKTITVAPLPPGIKKSDEKNIDVDNDAGILELNDLLDESQPEAGTPPSAIKKKGGGIDDEDMDLETLFFKDKIDDDDEGKGNLGALTDEGSAFWEDKK